MGPTLMAKDKNQISKRLAAISGAKPVEIDAPEIPRKRRIDRAPREDTFRAGKLYTSKNNFVPCIIRDASETGARARMEAEYSFPEIVVLRFDQTGVVKKAKVIWRDETDVGLQFLKDLTPKRPKPRIARKAILPNVGEEG